jgi:hypothetical protein
MQVMVVIEQLELIFKAINQFDDEIVLGQPLLSTTTRQGSNLPGRGQIVGVQVDSYSLPLLADRSRLRRVPISESIGATRFTLSQEARNA